LGWLDSAFNMAYTVFQVPTGLAGDRFGPAAVLPLMILGWSCAVGVTALGQGFWSLGAIRLGFGALQAGAYPNLTKVTRSWFPSEVRTTVQGFISVTGGRIGAACAPLVISSLLLGLLGLDWRMALVTIAAAGVFLALATRPILRDNPGAHPWTNAAERKLIGNDDPPTGQVAQVSFCWRPAVVASLGFLMLQTFTSTFADALFVYWIPLFLEEGKGLSKGAMGVFASLPLVGGALGGIAGGMLNDLIVRRTGNLRLARTTVGLAGKLVAAGLIAVSLSVESGRWMMAVVAVAKFFTDWSVPTVWGAVTDIGGRATGRVFGLVNTVGALGGFVAGPILGHTKQALGWSAVFWLIVAVYILSALCWLGVDPRRRLVMEDTFAPDSRQR
jgi:MFS family permease